MKNIVLTGLMGSGKTSAARALKKLFFDFSLIEIDELVVKKEKLSINEIFSKKGEVYFRKIEKETIDEVLKKENQIISLGGGSLENNFNFELAKKNSILFYLKADIDILYNRIKNNNDRPLLNCENPKEKLKNLLKMREENYKKSDYTIDVDFISPDITAKKIEEIYKNETRSN